MTEAPKQCCIEGCERTARGRGLCNSCYGTLLKAVNSGKTSWQELQDAGLTKPSCKRGRELGRARIALEAFLAKKK